MVRLGYFERLLESATVIARHPDCSTKRRVLVQCRSEVADLLVSGRIDASQAEEILAILGFCGVQSGCSRAG